MRTRILKYGDEVRLAVAAAAAVAVVAVIVVVEAQSFRGCSRTRHTCRLLRRNGLHW